MGKRWEVWSTDSLIGPALNMLARDKGCWRFQSSECRMNKGWREGS